MGARLLKNNSGFNYRSAWFLLLPGFFLIFFRPVPGYCQQLSGTVVNSVNAGIQGIQINAYIAPKRADGSFEWANSAFTDNMGSYIFSNDDGDDDNNLNHCRYYLEANAWETQYVSQYYNGGTGLTNPNRLGGTAEINLCSGGNVAVHFTLNNGGTIQGDIVILDNGVYTALDGMRIRASAVLTYDAQFFITLMNDPDPPHGTTFIDPDTGELMEILPSFQEIEDRVYIRDTYTDEVGTTVINGDTFTLCNLAKGAAPGSYSIQGIPQIQAADANQVPFFGSLNNSQIILEVGAESSRCGTPFNYPQQTTTINVPAQGMTTGNMNFTLQNGNELFGNIPIDTGTLDNLGTSLCNTQIGLYKETTVDLTTINVLDDGSEELTVYNVTFDKIEEIKTLNPIYPDWPDTAPETGYDDGAGTHLTCDNFNDPRYTNLFTFSNLEDGNYRIEYAEDFIWSVRQTFPASGYFTLQSPTTSLNVNLDITQGTAPLTAPRIFIHQEILGCAPNDRLTCWISGSPPEECPQVPEFMDPGVCNDYTSGNLLEAYALDSRRTHYFIDFFTTANCSNIYSTHIVENYSILNFDALTPRECECYEIPPSATYFQVRATNLFNTDTNTNSSNSTCQNLTDYRSYTYPIDRASIDMPPRNYLAKIKSADYISNTVANSAANARVRGLALKGKNSSFLHASSEKQDKNYFETIRLASLNWMDYLFDLFKKIAGKLDGRWTPDKGAFIEAGNYSDNYFMALAGEDSDQGDESDNSLVLPDPFLLEYVTSNLPDADGDSLPDYWEQCRGLDPNDPTGGNGTNGDPDGDGLGNYWEYSYGTDPYLEDSDNDGIRDDWEVRHRLDPLSDDSIGDADGDGWTNLDEYLNGTDPNRKAEVLYVDGNATNEEVEAGSDLFQTIGAALAEAGSGSVVQVLGGSFSQPLVYVPGDNLVVGAGVRLMRYRATTAEIDLAGAHNIELSDRASLIGFTIKNPPSSGPAVVVSSPAAKIANNIFIGTNDSNNSDTAILLNDSTSQIDNNLLWGFNSAISLTDSNPFIGNNIIAYCSWAVQVNGNSIPEAGYNSLWQNGGNGPLINDPNSLLANPLFVDENGGNFHLQGDSPLRDAGDGRQLFNDIDGSRNDIGPDGGPHGKADLNVPFSSIPASADALTIPIDGQISFDGGGSTDEWGIAEYCWNFGGADDSVCDSIEVNPVHQFDTCGNYPVTLTVTDHSGFNSAATVMVNVGNPADNIAFNVTPDVSVIDKTVTFSTNGEGEFNWTIDKLTGEETDYTCDTSAGKTITCDFKSPGLYEVIMSLGGESCKSVSRKLITVINQPEAGDDTVFKGSIGLAGGTLSAPTGVSLEIPADTLSELIPITISQISDIPPLPEEFAGIGIPFDLGPHKLAFCQPIQLIIPYDQDDLTQSGVTGPEDLRVVWFNEAAKAWKEIPVIEVDRESKLLLVEINHFSSYQIIADKMLEPPENLTATASQYNSEVALSWLYPSNYADGFFVERSNDQQQWTRIGQVGKNVKSVDKYTDTPNAYSTLFYYRVIAFKYRMAATGDITKSELSNVASAKTAEKYSGANVVGGGGGGDGDANSSQDSNNSGDSGTQSASSGGGVGSFGCSLRDGGYGNSGNILTQLFILFLPLFIFRRRIHRHRHMPDLLNAPVGRRHNAGFI